MKSREALENIVKFLEDLEDHSLIPAFTEYLKEIKVINKDLEVLNIFIELFDTEIIKLKKWCILDDVYQFMLQLKKEEFHITERQYKVIKEWLENEN